MPRVETFDISDLITVYTGVSVVPGADNMGDVFDRVDAVVHHMTGHHFNTITLALVVQDVINPQLLRQFPWLADVPRLTQDDPRTDEEYLDEMAARFGRTHDVHSLPVGEV